MGEPGKNWVDWTTRISVGVYLARCLYQIKAVLLLLLFLLNYKFLFQAAPTKNRELSIYMLNLTNRP